MVHFRASTASAWLFALEASGLATGSVGMVNVPWDNEGIDDEHAARQAPQHLLGLGHGVLAVLSSYQHPVVTEWALPEPIARGARPTAALAHGDESAFGALTAFRKRGLSARERASEY
ncbi:hypothetical protein [Arthrobacter sp. D5-1]|uniref:hypothetical protein n=1 Tax=Arthrobacter sp. D5-1 TaxID=1477518 RepID=UPI001A98C17A|nr:hypothetical protein [Arthrobacter sp. D5-1]QSZ47346.1 hypothetical protein AYX22_02185 [Arthrobacter sp. D5-1]